MSKRRSNTNQNQDKQIEDIIPAAVITKQTQRVSVRLFRMLKERLHQYRWNAPKTSSAEKSAIKTAFNIELTRKLRQTDKRVLIEMITTGMSSKAAQAFGLKTPENQQEDAQAQHRAHYARLVAQIDKAELAFLAGDSEPARALVEKVDAFIGATSNQ